MKKSSILFLAVSLQTGAIFCQSQVYDDFKGNKALHYGEKTGKLDTLAENPEMNSVNNTKKCAKYVRNGEKKFDVIKMNLSGSFSDSSINTYATYLGIPPKLKMKVYTTAPAGTLVEILLGRKSGNNDFPAGVNSQYQAHTTISNGWEELEFKFSQIPKGSETSASQIDQLTVLFNPNSMTSDTYYFADITGPMLTPLKKQTTNPTSSTMNRGNKK